MSTRPPTRTDRTPPAPTIAARGVVLVVIAAALGAFLLAKGLDGPSSADVNANPGAGGPAGVVQTTTATTVAPATTTTAVPVYDPTVRVLVVNASGVQGAAGALTERLGGELGILPGTPTDQPDGVPDIDQTHLYFTSPEAEPSARAIAAYLSSPTTTVPVDPLPSTELIKDGDTQGAGVVVMLGRDLATVG